MKGTVRVDDEDWVVALRGKQLVDLSRHGRGLEQLGYRHNTDYTYIKRGSRNWWLLVKPEVREHVEA